MPSKTSKKTTRRYNKKRTKLTAVLNILRAFGRFISNKTIAPILVICALSTWVYQSGEYHEWAAKIDEYQNKTTESLGLTIDNLVLDGQINATKEDIINILNNTEVRDYSAVDTKSIFNIDLNKAKEKIEELNWVKHASVERQYPSTISVGIIEYNPVALWQNNNRRVQLIDEKGYIIKENDIHKFSDLIILVGNDVPTYVEPFLNMINSEESLKGKTSSAARISKRRWNVTLFNNIEIKLPEESPEMAWSYLARTQDETSILDDSDIKKIDLRVQGKMFVQ